MRRFTFYLVLLIPCFSFSAQKEKASFYQSLDEFRFLDAWVETQSELNGISDKALVNAKRRIRTLSKSLNNEKSIQSRYLPDNYYIEGYEGFVQGNYDSALSAWKKYLEACRIGLNCKIQRREEVERWILKMEKKPVLIKSLKLKTTKSRFPVQRTSRVRKTPQKRRLVKGRNVEKLRERAVFAEQSGRFEQARHLYRLALKDDPSSELIAKSLSDLEEKLQE